MQSDTMQQTERVVITGLGVCAPNGVGLANFEAALRAGKSGLAHLPELADLQFRCQVGGVPPIPESLLKAKLTALEQKRLTAHGVLYGLLAALEAWENAGLALPAGDAPPDWDTGTIFGSGLSGVQTLREAIYKTDERRVKRLGGAVVEQTMPSGISALLSGRLALGNWVSSNASACSTGTEAIIMAAEHIRRGQAQRMLAGGCDADGPHVWGGFDAMRVLNTGHNDNPRAASRPLAADAAGFVPGSGAGALLLESLSSAQKRQAPILGEILGGAVNSGGQRGNGSMTAPHSEGVQRCIKAAVAGAGIEPHQIGLIAGHLTSTMGDVREVHNWAEALNRRGKDFPRINALKSMTGHCLSAAGAIETVGAVLQMANNFIHPSLNADALHPQIAELIDADCVPREHIPEGPSIIAKSSFGFGDVNACLILKKWNP
ncbi:MAG: beta-ketoacyl-[acyl-carrier-protein] synthase family protein [Schleiferiaceae bacterium]|nr:beta-ketoacyl-[acyl-carrier-protein] synthase family protein [Schleiferiaceae bacterium]